MGSDIACLGATAAAPEAPSKGKSTVPKNAAKRGAAEAAEGDDGGGENIYESGNASAGLYNTCALSWWRMWLRSAHLVPVSAQDRLHRFVWRSCIVVMCIVNVNMILLPAR
jgi:hypothetical protein